MKRDKSWGWICRGGSSPVLLEQGKERRRGTLHAPDTREGDRKDRRGPMCHSRASSLLAREESRVFALMLLVAMLCAAPPRAQAQPVGWGQGTYSAPGSTTSAKISGAGGLLSTNNLSDVASEPTAAQNLLSSIGAAGGSCPACIVIGSHASFASGTGVNTQLGYYAGNGLTTGYDNTLIGAEAGQTISTANNDVGVGLEALQLETTGNSNTAVGTGAGKECSSSACVNNVAIGAFTMNTATDGYSNTLVGAGVATNAIVPTHDTIIGQHALYQEQGQGGAGAGAYNQGLGQANLYSSLNGQDNIAIGYAADFFSPLPNPGFALASASGAGLSIGTYLYKVADVLNGQLSDLTISGSATVTTTSGNQQVSITSIPTYAGPLTCSARKIYRTKVNPVLGATSEIFYFVATISDNTTTTYTDSTADSSLTTVPADPSGSLIIGNSSDVGLSQTAYKGGQAVFGTWEYPYTEFWLGSGVYGVSGTAPSNTLVSASGGNGTNVGGANLTLAGGPGTGTAASGSVLIQAAAAGTSGSTWNSESTVAAFGPARAAFSEPVNLENVTYTNLPSSPSTGDKALVTDATSCIAGTAVSAGSGSTPCEVTYNGTSWMPAGGAQIAQELYVVGDTNLSTSNAGTNTMQLSGAILTTLANETLVQQYFKHAATFSNLHCALPGSGVAPGTSNSYTFVLRDNGSNAGGSPGTPTCVISGSGTTCDDTTDTFTSTAGHFIDYENTTTVGGSAISKATNPSCQIQSITTP